MSIAYKSKPSHDKRFQKLMGSVRNDANLVEIMTDEGLESLLGSAPQEGVLVKEQMMQISQASKLSILMQTCKQDSEKKEALLNEFQQLIHYII